MKHTKIVCTLGPSSGSPDMLDKLIAAGMDCARLNFSHGTHETHGELAKQVREAAKRARRPIAILADLCGPKMRIGKFPNGPIELARGQRFTFTNDLTVDGDDSRVSVSYEPLPRDVKPGDEVLLDDGLLRLRVDETTDTEVNCTVMDGGPLSDRKGLNLPGANLSTPALTDKDKVDLEFAVHTLHADYLALSFVRHPEDVKEAQELADGTPVIAKIEKPEAIDNIEAICDTADGIMVARGDLGVEMGSAKVPLIQKRIIAEVNARGKIVITATQMLDSMMRNPRPTRAEAADVANAVIDGTDAVMLSGETASGQYPVEAVEMMAEIICEVENQWLPEFSARASLQRLKGQDEWPFATAAARAAALMTGVLSLRAVVTFTHDGRSASLISEHRPVAPIVAITSDPQLASRMALEWGVVPRLEVPPEDLEESLRIASSLLVREKLCASGDTFAMVVGWPLSGGTNTVKLHRL